MKKKDLKYFEKKLLEERENVLKELGYFDENYSTTIKGATGDLSAYSFHMADLGTDAMEREKAFLFASQEGKMLYSIDESLRKIYNNGENFGTCDLCNEPINFERLDAIPYTNLCIDCKKQEEGTSLRS